MYSQHLFLICLRLRSGHKNKNLKIISLGVRKKSVDFENLSNSLFHEWNNFDENAITESSDTTNLSNQPPQSNRNRIELELIFVRVGLQRTVACKLADEIYDKLDLSADQTINFSDFVALMQCDLEALRRQQQQAPIQPQSIASTKYSDDEYSNNPITDGMIIDLQSHSGLLPLSLLCLLCFLFFLNLCHHQ